MKYTEIAKAEGLNDRQQSLFNILDAAVHAAKHEGEEPLEIVVIRAPLHVDEYVDSEHVYAPKMAVEAGLIYKKRPGFEWQIDAVVGPTGSVFYTDTADALVVLHHTQKDQVVIDIKIEGHSFDDSALNPVTNEKVCGVCGFNRASHNAAKKKQWSKPTLVTPDNVHLVFPS